MSAYINKENEIALLEKEYIQFEKEIALIEEKILKSKKKLTHAMIGTRKLS